MLAKLSVQTKILLILGLIIVIITGVVIVGAFNRTGGLAPSSTKVFGGVTIQQDPRTSPDDTLASGSVMYITNADKLTYYLTSSQLFGIESQIKQLIYDQNGTIVTLATVSGAVTQQNNGGLKFGLLTSDNHLYSIAVTSDGQGTLTAQLTN